MYTQWSGINTLHKYDIIVIAFKGGAEKAGFAIFIRKPEFPDIRAGVFMATALVGGAVYITLAFVEF